MLNQNLDRYSNDQETIESLIKLNINETNFNYLNKLPDELLSKICEYLNFNDFIRLSRADRRWNFIVHSKTSKFNELAIFLNEQPHSERMYFTNKIINYSNTILLPSLYCLFIDEFRLKFKDIQYLIIINNFDDNIQPTKLDFNDKIFDCFTKLKHIELRNFSQIRGKLDLINLESLYVSTNLESNFIISSPNLTELAFFGKAKPTLIHTKNLKTIAAQSLTSPFIGYGFLNNECESFQNLIAYDPTQIKWIMNKFQKRLNQIQILNQLKVHEIKNLIKEANELRLKNLELLYFGINVYNNKFRQILDELHDETVFLVENLDEQFIIIFSENLIDFMDSLDYVKEILINNFCNLINEKLISNLINLQILTIQSTNEMKLNSSILIKFMKKSTKLKKLNLELIDINQEDLDLLPINFKFLTELKIVDCKINNLDFINKFKYLETFITNCDLNVRQTTKLLLECCPVKIIFC